VSDTRFAGSCLLLSANVTPLVGPEAKGPGAWRRWLNASGAPVAASDNMLFRRMPRLGVIYSRQADQRHQLVASESCC